MHADPTPCDLFDLLCEATRELARLDYLAAQHDLEAVTA